MSNLTSKAVDGYTFDMRLKLNSTITLEPRVNSNWSRNDKVETYDLEIGILTSEQKSEFTGTRHGVIDSERDSATTGTSRITMMKK